MLRSGLGWYLQSSWAFQRLLGHSGASEVKRLLLRHHGFVGQAMWRAIEALAALLRAVLASLSITTAQKAFGEPLHFAPAGAGEGIAVLSVESGNHNAQVWIITVSKRLVFQRL